VELLVPRADPPHPAQSRRDQHLSAHPDKEVQKKLPGAAEYIVAEELTTVLKPFYEATTALEGSVYPTLSLVHYLVVGITICLSNVLKNGSISQVVKVLAQKLQDKLLDKWTNKLAKVSTTITAMLDIRTKDLNFFPRADRERMWTLLEETAVRFHEAREAKGKFESQAIESKQPEASSASEKGMDVWEVMSAFQCTMTEEDLQEPSEPAHDPGGLKSHIYLKIQDWRKVPSQPMRKIINGKTTFNDPLDPWRDTVKQNRLPRLRKLAQAFLAISAASVPSERVGSVAGAISSKARNRLLPEKVAKLTFTKMNWHHVGHKSFRDREKATALAEKAIEAAEQAIAAAAAASVPAAWTASAQNNCK